MSNQERIFNTIVNLRLLPKTTVSTERDGNIIQVIHIEHEQEYVPNFSFVWCKLKQHYRVYIYIGSRDYNKQNAGYCICTVSNGLVAAGFVTLYSFLHKNRANNKEAAY